MSRLIVLLLLSVALGIGAGFGCYTMVRHPGPAEATFDDSADNECLGCHAGSEYDHWTDPYYTSFYNSAPSTWGAYYAHPWWYNEYWNRVPGARGDSTSSVTGPGRHAWDRGGGAPYLPPVGGAPAPTPGAQGTISSTPDTTKGPAPSNPKERTPDAPRHGWSR